jgi:hypothetical protein
MPKEVPKRDRDEQRALLEAREQTERVVAS